MRGILVLVSSVLCCLALKRTHGFVVPLSRHRSLSQSHQVSVRLHSKSTQEGEQEPLQETVMVEPGGENDVFTKEQWDEIEEAQPSQLSVMKELLGINVFTYILAFLIVAFGGMNLILGPGWLGGTLGIEGTGNIEQVSPSLPQTMDLGKDEYLL
ncbi:expressed unknown protein [Seminavis robusta]|uniref:Uncharacterized protein n=1 Tax=Seminavis robusta TaxID=568900 RepID=A0A9N8DB16_9STRA|nr:expressed unknown protein [Seminavis robusta]|eukprot:Sro59_g034430.1 n/a (155) ;mRNA; r:137665-138267